MDDSFQVDVGMSKARDFLLQVNEIGLPAGTEALDPNSPQYYGDLISWTAIGARTTESQTHREMSSGLSTPVGFKNGTDGNMDIAINAIPLSLSSAEHSEQETFYDSIASATEAALLSVMNTVDLPADRLTQTEKLQIIQLLSQKGVFTLKGAVPIVAQNLSCSQASIYRYLSKINRERQTSSGSSGENSGDG